VIPPDLVLPQMVHAIDILPTIADYAGAVLPSVLEGQSMRPYFENPKLPGREFLLNSRAARGFLRTREGMRFHLIHDRVVRLYDLKVDPDERRNLAGQAQYADQIEVWTQVLRNFLAH